MFDAERYEECYLFYEGLWNDSYVKSNPKLSAAELEKLDDIYVVAKDFSWTYVHTHELVCGPYFCKKHNSPYQLLQAGVEERSKHRS